MKRWAVVAEVDGETRWIRQVNYRRLVHWPIFFTQVYANGTDRWVHGNPRRYSSMRAAAQAALMAMRFEGVEDARLVNLVLDRNGMPYKRP